MAASGKGGQHRKPSVLCPGCGLARLPFELACRGYAAQGNEFSYHMLLGSFWVLNCAEESRSQAIYPYALSVANRRGEQDHLREIRIPDVSPTMECPKGAAFSMAAGDFVEVYGQQLQEWDAVLTPFFVDTAKNIFIYIRVIADILKPGGLWINKGPLLFHYAEMQSEISVELSWEEIRPVVCRYFDIKEEDRQYARYTTNPGSMMGVLYRCLFFVAVRNDTPTQGTSNPVF